MSRKIGALALALGILVGAMELKSLVTAHGRSGVIMANGVSPVPKLPLPPAK
jgi:hypothetical protein